MAAKKFTPKPGAKFRTNDMFKVRWKMVWRGVILRANPYIAGCWIARVDGFEKEQHVNEKWMEGVDQ